MSSVLVTRPITRSDSVVAPWSTVPPGTSTFCDARVRCTSTAVSPNDWSRAGSSTRLICRARPPSTVTPPTPLRDSMRRRSTRSAYSVSSRDERGAESAASITGAASGSERSTRGCWTSRGSSVSARLTRSRTSWAATEVSLSRSNCATTTDRPS